MPRGLFVLFEGVDRCGTSTQARRLVDRLVRSGQPATLLRFPDRDTTIGGMINAYLTNKAELDDHAVHLLFSANRWEKRCVRGCGGGFNSNARAPQSRPTPPTAARKSWQHWRRGRTLW